MGEIENVEPTRTDKFASVLVLDDGGVGPAEAKTRRGEPEHTPAGMWRT